MKLVDVYLIARAPQILYELLSERPAENFISHKKMPTMAEHEDFVAEVPFRFWYLMRVSDLNGPIYVGALECTELNEIGIAVFKRYQKKGYGRAALKLFLATHKPLPAIPARRNGRWLANIAPGNEAGLRFFSRNGFRPVQETWEIG